MSETDPIPFEVEFPEAGHVLGLLSQYPRRTIIEWHVRKDGTIHDFTRRPMQDRNEKCWCGSGKKFKKCCANHMAELQQDPSWRYGTVPAVD
jgi:hypothetical protein